MSFVHLYKTSSLNSSLNSFNIELKKSFFANFASALYSKHSVKRNASAAKTFAK